MKVSFHVQEPHSTAFLHSHYTLVTFWSGFCIEFFSSHLDALRLCSLLSFFFSKVIRYKAFSECTIASNKLDSLLMDVGHECSARATLCPLCFWFIIFLDRISQCRLKGSTQVASEFHLCFLWLVWPCWFHPAWAGEVHIQLLNNENEHQSLRPWSLAAVVTSTYHTVWVYFFLSLFSSDSKQLLYHLLTKSVTFSIMCWRNKINKMKSYCSIPQKKSTSLFFFLQGKKLTKVRSVLKWGVCPELLHPFTQSLLYI